jgi:protein-tyrosine phosphatase
MNWILVVCTGNVCRSPMAEGFLRTALADRLGDEAPVVTSAGTAGWEGSAATEESVQSAREWGTDIRAHVARRIQTRMIEEADLILCMAADHRASILRVRPDVRDKTFTLKELVRLLEAAPTGGPIEDRIAVAAAARNGSRGHGEDVRDPLGDPIDGYRQVADELHDLSGRLAAALIDEPA